MDEGQVITALRSALNLYLNVLIWDGQRCDVCVFLMTHEAWLFGKNRSGKEHSLCC
jgi:hypothetical protein